MNQHLSDRQRLAYASGDLGEADMAEVDAHVAACPTCEEGLAEALEFEAAARRMARVTPRPGVYQTRPIPVSWRFGMLAAAAGLALAIGVGVWRFSDLPPPAFELTVEGGRAATMSGGAPSSGTFAHGDIVELRLRPDSAAVAVGSVHLLRIEGATAVSVPVDVERASTGALALRHRLAEDLPAGEYTFVVVIGPPDATLPEEIRALAPRSGQAVPPGWAFYAARVRVVPGSP